MKLLDPRCDAPLIAPLVPLPPLLDYLDWQRVEPQVRHGKYGIEFPGFTPLVRFSPCYDQKSSGVPMWHRHHRRDAEGKFINNMPDWSLAVAGEAMLEDIQREVIRAIYATVGQVGEVLGYDEMARMVNRFHEVSQHRLSFYGRGRGDFVLFVQSGDQEIVGRLVDMEVRDGQWDYPLALLVCQQPADEGDPLIDATFADLRRVTVLRDEKYRRSDNGLFVVVSDDDVGTQQERLLAHIRVRPRIPNVQAIWFTNPNSFHSIMSYFRRGRLPQESLGAY